MNPNSEQLAVCITLRNVREETTILENEIKAKRAELKAEMDAKMTAFMAEEDRDGHLDTLAMVEATTYEYLDTLPLTEKGAKRIDCGTFTVTRNDSQKVVVLDEERCKKALIHTFRRYDAVNIKQGMLRTVALAANDPKMQQFHKFSGSVELLPTHKYAVKETRK